MNQQLAQIIASIEQTQDKPQRTYAFDFEEHRDVLEMEVRFARKRAREAELSAMPYPAYLQTAEWIAIRDIKRFLARGRCELCYSPDSLEVHHRTYERRGAELLSDLIVLCGDCHGKFHGR